MHGNRCGIRAGVPIVAALCLLLSACSEDESTAPGDTTPPSKVTDLAAIAPTANTVKLTWTSPGDDGAAGTAAQYDIRSSLNPLTEAVWPLATQAAGEPSPRAAGSRDTFVVTGLEPNTLYYFSLKAADEAGNWSEKSIIASANTTAAP